MLLGSDLMLLPFFVSVLFVYYYYCQALSLPFTNMPKTRLQLSKIENRSRRNVRFCKRKNNLLKKAFELNVLCDAEVAVLLYSDSGKFYQFSNPMMNTILAKYKFCYHYGMDVDRQKDKAENLLTRIQLLEQTKRNIMGEDLDSLSPTSLDRLEKKLRSAKRRVFNRKIKLLYEEIHVLAEEVRNRNLEKKTLKAQLRCSDSTQQTIG